VAKTLETTTARILTRPLSQAPEVLAEGKRLPLVVGTQAGSVDPLGPGSKPFEQDFERGLAVVHHERTLARPALHAPLGAQERPAPPAESGIEEARVMRADFPGPGVVDDHFGGELRGHADAPLREKDEKPVAPQDVQAA